MKIKTQDLTGPALDWAVAKCVWPDDIGNTVPFHHDGSDYSPSRKWAHGGPIIEREKIRLDQSDHPEMWPWFATKVTGWEKREDEEMGDWPVYAEAGGDTPLVAAMRCYVASKLGDEIDVPDELV